MLDLSCSTTTDQHLLLFAHATNATVILRLDMSTCVDMFDYRIGHA